MTPPLKLEDRGGQGPALHFAHANGFPPGTYRRLLEQFAPHAHVYTLEGRCLVPGMDPAALRDWDELAEDLAQALRARGLGPVLGVGHSVGGTATLLAAAKYPELFQAVVMLDPVLFTGPRAVALRLLGLLGLGGRVPPASLARRRREHWTSREEAGASYGKKALFRGFDPACFQDYLTHGLTDVPGGGVRLTIPRAWEARIFETPPQGAWKRLREARVPVLVLRGSTSDTFTVGALARVRRLRPDVQTDELPGGHLFPLERPEPCARRVLDFLQTVGARPTA